MKNPRTPEEVVELQAEILNHQREVIIRLTTMIEQYQGLFDNTIVPILKLRGLPVPEIPKIKEIMKGVHEQNLSQL